MYLCYKIILLILYANLQYRLSYLFNDTNLKYIDKLIFLIIFDQLIDIKIFKTIKIR